MQPPLPGDKVAGYVGMIAGFVTILITVVVITRLTSRSFESHAGAPHAPAAAGAPAPAPH
jgi:predicted cobalt transporter CbtA